MKHLDELPGGELLDEMICEAQRESDRIYEDQAFYVSRGLHENPAACQMHKADLLAGIAQLLSSLRAEGVELGHKRKAGTFGQHGKPERPDIIREELIGRLIKNARAEIKIQRQKREPNDEQQPATIDPSDSDTVAA